MADAAALPGPRAVHRRVASGRTWAAATLLVALTLAGAAGAAIVNPRVQHVSGNGYGELLLVFLLTVVGFILVIRRPRNPIGWLLLSSGTCFILSGFATSYSSLDYVHDHGSLPLGWVALLLAEFWAPAILFFSLAAFLFPEGRAGSRTMRALLGVLFLAALVWQGGAFGIAVSAIVNHSIHIDRSGDLYAIDHPVGSWAWWYTAAQPAFFVTLATAWVGWLVRQVPAHRRATGDRRLQLKWLYGGTATCGVGGILIAAFTSAKGPVHAVAIGGDVLLCALPLCVGVALLKFRLYDIDRVVSRTVSYALLTGALVGLYAGIVTFVTRVLPLSSSVGVAASTLVAAAAFSPLRRRLQRAVDRRFNRARYDAEVTVTAFAGRLRESVDPTAVTGDLIEVVHAAFEPAAAVLWLRRGTADRASRPEAPGLPLHRDHAVAGAARDGARNA